MIQRPPQKKRRSNFILIITMLVIAFTAGCNGGGVAPFKIVVFSDVHFNPFYDPAIFQSLLNAPESEWAEIFNGSTVTGPQTWGQDTYYPLLMRTFAKVCGQAARTPFVIFPGDILTHEFSSKFYALYGATDEAAMRAFTLKTVAFFAAQVREHCGDIPIMPSLGNNDSYAGDYQITPGGKFLSDTSNIYLSTLMMNKAGEESFTSTWTAGGYYVANSLASDLAIINLNTILFSRHSPSGYEAATLAQLSWFREALASTRAEGRRVWLLLHIPPGIDIFSTVTSYMDDTGHLSDATMMWQDEYQAGFLETLGEYSDIIDAIFAGHTHMDEYRLAIKVGASRQGWVMTTPSISPIYGNNPAFKILTVSGGGWKTSDYESLNNSLSQTDQIFRYYYTFSDVYGLSGILENSFPTLYQELGTDETKHQTYVDFYYSGHNETSPINDTNWPAYRCGIGEMLKESYLQCVNE